MLSYKTFGLVLLASAGISFALGRYTNRGITKAVDVVKDRQTAQDTHRTTVIVTAPNGQRTTTETTQIDTHVSTEVKRSAETQIAPKRPVINFSALVGSDVNKHFEPIYGVSINKEFIGPVTIGAWGLNNGTMGLSIGVSF